MATNSVKIYVRHTLGLTRIAHLLCIYLSQMNFRGCCFTLSQSSCTSMYTPVARGSAPTRKPSVMGIKSAFWQIFALLLIIYPNLRMI